MDDDELETFARSRVGTKIRGRWRLDELLGVGGTASVYAATHRKGKRVAVKILHPDLSANKQFRDRFLREGYVGNLIEHEGAVTVHDDDETSDGCALLVMDLLEGENLEVRRVRKGGTMDPLEVLSLMDDVLDTLRAAHLKGVVHRDIKPENLFLTKTGLVKLLDFGIAHIKIPKDPSATLAGVAMGTPAFMPPEQASARWEEVDERSDIWGLGASMFTMLTGRYVHEGSTVNEALALAVTQEPRSVAEVAPHLPQPIVDVVDRAIARNKDDRWASAAEMQIAIRIAYRELQGDLPDGERYSLSHGRVRQHSAPPSIEQTLARTQNVSRSSATEDPVSAEIAELKRSPLARRVVLVAATLGTAFAVVIAYSLLSSDEDVPTATSTVAAEAPLPALPPPATAYEANPPTEHSTAALEDTPRPSELGNTDFKSADDDDGIASDRSLAKRSARAKRSAAPRQRPSSDGNESADQHDEGSDSPTSGKGTPRGTAAGASKPSSPPASTNFDPFGERY